MPSKKLNIISLSIDPEIQDKLKKYAKNKGTSASKVVRDLVDKYLSVEDEVIPVILKIPVTMKGDTENLQNWLDGKVSAIVKALAP